MMAWTEATLDKLLTTPSAGLVEDMKKLIREHGKQKKQDGKKNGDY